jgi:hypothetical protein
MTNRVKNVCVCDILVTIMVTAVLKLRYSIVFPPYVLVSSLKLFHKVEKISDSHFSVTVNDFL